MKRIAFGRWSVTNMVLALSSLLLCLTFMSLGTIVRSIQSQTAAQQVFMDRTAASDQVVADLSAMQQLFRVTGHSDFDDDFQPYLAACADLDQSIDILRKLTPDSEELLNFLRRAESFNEYQRHWLQLTIDGEHPYYDVYRYISDGLARHLAQAIEVSQRDTSAARAAYIGQMQALYRSMHILAAVFTAACLLLALLYAFFLRDVRRTFQRVAEYCARLADREWEIEDLSGMRYREFVLIAETVNHMKDEIRSHIRKIESQAELERQLNEEKLINEQQRAMMAEAQMSALRAQVNPHFLFNALNLIGVSSMVGSADMVMQIVEATGRILRYSLYHNDKMTDLDDELEVVDQYLYIQKCRFHDSFTVMIHNELEGEGVRIPTMSVQPIVENSFKHGFGNRKDLRVELIVRKEGDRLEIVVSDDGVGFDPACTDQKSGGIGLTNIRRRLELIYGRERVSMKIQSEPGKGSSITLHIPYEVAE